MKRKLKILIVSQYFWPENFRVNDLSRWLVERGHDVTALTGIPNYPSGKFFEGYGVFKNMRQDYHGVKVARTPLWPRGGGGKINLMLNYLSHTLSASLLGPFVCRGEYDVIFVFEPSPITIGLPAIVMKKAKRAPIVFWTLDLWPESLSATGAINSKKILGLVRKLVRFIYKRCDLILAQSKGFINHIRDTGGNGERIRYYPSWAEDIFSGGDVSAPPSRASLGLPEGFLVMYAGNIGAAQDFESALDAAQRLKENRNIRWALVGDGRMRPWVESEIKRRGLEETVSLPGQHPLESMPAFFSSADALLVTLKRNPIWSLTIPGKLQSYLAAGRPVVAVLEGEGARIVEEAGAGAVCAPHDGESLSKAVTRLYEMGKDEREAMGKRGRKYYEENFDRKTLFDRLEGWFYELAGE